MGRSQLCLDIKHCNSAVSFKQTATVQTACRQVQIAVQTDMGEIKTNYDQNRRVIPRAWETIYW